MSKTFYTVKDGKIDRIQTGESPVGEGSWQEAPENWGGNHGDKLEWFDENMRRIPDHELVEQGKRIDKRGVWYSKEKAGETIYIYDRDHDPGDDYTRESPLEKEPHQKFDRQKNKWVVDTEKKERAKKESAVSKIRAQIEDAEKRIIRPLRAINRGRATEEDIDTFERYDTLIEEELRPELNRLEEELKSA